MPSRKRKDGEKGSGGDCGGHRCSRHPPKPPLQPGAGELPRPPHVQLRTCIGCGSAEGHMTCPQQLARAFRLHETGAGKGTRGCNRSFYLQPLLDWQCGL